MPDQALSGAQKDRLFETAIGWAEQNVLKLIATRALPLLLAWGIFNGGIAWVQETVGIDLPDEVIAGYLVTMLAGGVVAVFAWVRNHGQGAGAIIAALVSAERNGSSALVAVGPVNTTEVNTTEESTSEAARASWKRDTTQTVDVAPPLLSDDHPSVGVTAGTPPLTPGA